MNYLDNAATTRIREDVLETMLPYLSNEYGNPSSVYSLGRQARAALDKARSQVQKALHAKLPREIFFTGGGSESDNWAIKGVAYANADKGRHIVTTKAEHHAVLEACEDLEKQGFTVSYVDVDAMGMVRVDDIKKALRKDTILVSVMMANNEVGTVNPIDEIGRLAHERGILFHTDAVQAAGHLPIRLSESTIDLLSISGHKFHAPKGVGALYIKTGTRIDRLVSGGKQERGRRAGTENLASIVGMGAAIALAEEEMQAEWKRQRTLQKHMVQRFLSEVDEAVLNGHPVRRLAGNVNVSFPGTDAEVLIYNLDQQGIACSSGSACTSGSLEPSHVLAAMGVAGEVAKSALRFSFSRYTTLADVDAAVDAVKETLSKSKKNQIVF